ncbi:MULTISPECIES: helix-turn-helix domain-containing protein [Rhodococcus]|uniref:helix-turn-helix domain-containing protein n=1 Tax=Rhodococcus TaxID=1827 RepID=UPI000C7CFCD3|nr:MULTISPECIES: helix-turn-helix domain-containing protein [Rhodococcus]AUM18282.1 hypothetical protein CSW53_18175 [Rhodococcus ruber]NCL73720.1 hypothetical protein [Rhodococcus sp. YH1]
MARKTRNETTVDLVTVTPIPVGAQLISARDAAKLVSVSYDTVMEAARRGDLPGYSLGPKLTRFKVVDVLEWATRVPYDPSAAA